jgi:hypothetical protein
MNVPTDPVAIFQAQLKKTADDFLNQLPKDRETLRTALRVLAPQFELVKALHSHGPADASAESLVQHFALGIALVSLAIEHKKEVVLAANKLGSNANPAEPTV